MRLRSHTHRRRSSTRSVIANRFGKYCILRLSRRMRENDVEYAPFVSMYVLKKAGTPLGEYDMCKVAFMTNSIRALREKLTELNCAAYNEERFFTQNIVLLDNVA